MLNYTEPAKLSPSQQAVLHAISKNGIRDLPKGFVLDKEYSHLTAQLTVLGCLWEWSWVILQEAKTADYRRRFHEVNKMPGYRIISFHARYLQLDEGKLFTRHGYILIPPSTSKEKR